MSAAEVLAGARSWWVEQGDCLTVLGALPDDSVDAVVTDPPYDLRGAQGVKGGGFMGLAWDATGVAFRPETWREVLRVLKPGGHLLAFGGTRTYHRMTCAIEDAGFEIRDSLHWIYGSGFPKSLDVSKAIDKAAGAEREVVGPRVRVDGKAPGRISGGKHGAYGDYGDLPTTVTAPATAAAREWQGWGSALKPAHEPVVLARKPLGAPNIAANVARHGTGALNIDASRTATDGEVRAPQSDPSKRRGIVGTDLGITNAGREKFQAAQAASTERLREMGRWPPNVLLGEWREPVVRLMYNTPDDIEQAIRGYFRGYDRVPLLPEGGAHVPEQGGPPGVLRPGLLRGLDEREPDRRERSALREGPHTGGARPAVRDGEGAGAGRSVEPVLEGRPSPQQGLCDGGAHGVVGSGSASSRTDGEPQFGPLRAGAPPRDGEAARPPVDAPRGSASHQWDQVRQPAREPDDEGHQRPQEGPRRDLAGFAEREGRERPAALPALHVLECDVPAGWRSYFEVTDRTVLIDSAAAELDRQSGDSRGSGTPDVLGRRPRGMGEIGERKGDPRPNAPGYEDAGGASRFFPVFKYEAKADRAERDFGLPPGQRSNHPTVKPVALMLWLVRLVTPPGGVVLDPFTGSGTTGVAALRAGFRFVGVEREPEYAALARARIGGDAPLFNLTDGDAA